MNGCWKFSHTSIKFDIIFVPGDIITPPLNAWTEIEARLSPGGLTWSDDWLDAMFCPQSHFALCIEKPIEEYLNMRQHFPGLEAEHFMNCYLPVKNA